MTFDFKPLAELLSKAIEKNYVEKIAGTAVVSLPFFIFLPNNIGGIEKMSVYFIFVTLSACFLMISFSLRAWKRIELAWARKIRAADVKEFVANLGEGEKAALREFRLQGCQTIMMPIDDPAISGLISRGFLKQTYSIGKSILGIGEMFNLTKSYEFEHCLSDEALGFSTPNPERPEWALKWAERQGL
jgi:hypothetical protein